MPAQAAPLQHRSMSTRRRYVDTRLGQAHLRTAAPADPRGLPLLCLPPQPMSGRALEPLLTELGRRRLVVAADLPGFGLSDVPIAPPALDDYLGWVLDLADALSLERFAVLGWLTGGRFAAPLAARHAARVEKLVLLGAPTLTPEQRAAHPAPTLPTPRRDGSHLSGEWSRWLGWWQPDAEPLAISDDFVDTLYRLGREDRGWITEVSHAVHYDEWLPQVQAPVLVINPAGLMHEATAQVAPYLRRGRVIDVAPMMFPLLSAAHAAEAAALIDGFLQE